MDVRLPIDVVPGTDPPIFKWWQVVDTVVGRDVIKHESMLPPTVEVAVERIISVAKQSLMENVFLKGQVAALQKRIEEQGKTAVVQPVKKGK